MWFGHDVLPGFEDSDFLGLTLRIETFTIIFFIIRFAVGSVT